MTVSSPGSTEPPGSANWPGWSRSFEVRRVSSTPGPRSGSSRTTTATAAAAQVGALGDAPVVAVVAADPRGHVGRRGMCHPQKMPVGSASMMSSSGAGEPAFVSSG